MPGGAAYIIIIKCYRKILRIGWTQKVTNEELYRKIQLTETLLQLSLIPI